VAYVRVWESLGDTLKRVISSGLSRKEAKTDLCHAIADRKIGIRLTVAFETDAFTAYRQMVTKAQGLGSYPKHPADAAEYFEGANVKVPSMLKPNDFDWQKSRPRKPWPIRPRGGRRGEWKWCLPSLIELRTAEVLSWILETYRNATEKAGRPTAATAPESAATMRPTPESKIEEAISAAYDTAEQEKSKPPNLKEIAKPVQDALRAEGYEASGRRTQKIAEAEKFQRRRRRPGRTWTADIQ
jgi:hypothetical protein